MNKKTLIIVGTALILILVGVGMYLYFNKAPMGPSQTGGLFPDASQQITGAPQNQGTNDDDEANIPFVPGLGAVLPRLYELHKNPVAGSSFIESGKGADRTVRARYIQRGLGHIYETPLDTLSESRISNETHSRLSEALWGSGGKSVVIRSFDENEGLIKTRILNLGGIITSFARGTSTAQTGDFIQTEQVFLPDYIPFIATAEDGADKIFYLENGNTSSVGSIATFRGVSTGIFSSTFTEWLPQFPNTNLVTLTTKPSASVPGHLFFLDTKTKATTKIVGGINGLTTLTSRDGKSVLFSETKDGVPELSVYSVAKKEIMPLFIQTLPEKCAWSTKESDIVYCAVPQTLPTAQYPDQWYQGLVSFSDSIWKINTITSVAEKIYTLPSLDVINPTISFDDTYFLFMNKITSTPWVYRMSEEALVATVATETLIKNTPQTVVTETPIKTTIPTAINVTEGMVKIK